MARNPAKIVEKLYKIGGELEECIKKESDLVKQSKEGAKTLKMKRQDGIEETEAELWEELRVVGLEGIAAKKLGKKYPKTFKAIKKSGKKSQELNKYLISELGINFRAMTFIDYMKLTELIFDYKIKQHEQNK